MPLIPWPLKFTTRHTAYPYTIVVVVQTKLQKNARHRLVSTFLAALLSYEISQCRLICSWCSYRSVHSKSLLIRLISHSLFERKNTQKWAKIASPLTNVMCWRFFWPQTSIWDIMKKIRFEVRMIVLLFFFGLFDEVTYVKLFGKQCCVSGNDSFIAFEEILLHAVQNNVDFILLGGDLFHDANPSQNSLQKYVFGIYNCWLVSWIIMELE